ncbi:MAG: LysR family transcriptional regulator [Acidimicrobiales bacterium]
MPLQPTTPELSALDLFVSVVNLGSLSKAAAAHQIAQPSASTRIRSLERQLGVTLLDRSPTGSVPTTAGSLVAGWAEGVLRSANELNAGVAALKARRAGRLRVAASFTIAEYLLPPLLEQFLRNRSEESIKLEVANSTAVLDRLEAGTADLGFIESPTPTPTMNEQLVAYDRLITVVGRSHPWARLQTVPLEALATTSLTVRERGSGTREALEAALIERGYDAPVSALELGSTSAVRAAVMAGGPPAVISHRAVGPDLDAGSLVEIDVPGLRIERRLRAVWPIDSDLPPLAEDLLAQIPKPS